MPLARCNPSHAPALMRRFYAVPRHRRLSSITATFWRVYSPVMAPFPATRKWLSSPSFGMALVAQEYSTSLKPRCDASTVAKHEVGSHSEEKSLSGSLVHSTSPASFGISAWGGYHELVSVGTPLPCRRSDTLVSVFYHIGDDTLIICGRSSFGHRPVELAALPVLGIRKAKKEDTKMRITIALNKELTGVLTARFTPEYKLNKGEAYIEFNGSPALNSILANDPAYPQLHRNILSP
ncbi:hypothetical protein LTR47_006977 [Exophiala xenobiotica]|nr:hypothetical protein LTR72_011510 [Exophiala xenobiotica]KAK5231844.1 hypothetical protein LTR47_006977 [Exophiala xenobiotica]KAK5246062.1 hypothetical protein LTS06_008578 [Exophiala xenobiotica]KAK5283241.1 hypothetical protein LTR40_002079 [Exophiala xenobiotica]KAK5284756.1 hypothetical protein LTR14_011519 [Exophiala xenobiotica]